jgi:protease I
MRWGTVVRSHNNKECLIDMAKIATVITDMFEDIEFTSPKEALEAAGHQLVTIDTEAGKEVKGKHGEPVKIDKGIEEVNASEFDALFIPGGFSPDILRADDRVVAFVKSFMDDMKPTFAICHGPQLLITAKTLNGRDATGYKSIQVDLENAGAIFHDEEVFVCQKQLVTSRTPDDLPAFNREIVKLLDSK